MAQIVSGLPVIRIPVKMKDIIKVAQKTKKRRERDATIEKHRQGDRKMPIITCTRPQLNFYKGQTYDKFSTIPLASQGWNNRKSKGSFFRIHSYGKNPAFTESADIANNFEDLELDNRIIEQCHNLGFSQPTNIQSLAIPHILSGSNTLLAAETGNGKTLAYLAPILQKILELKTQTGDVSFNTPRALVIVPGRELVTQIRDMARAIGSNLGININSVTGGFTRKMMLRPRMQTPDLLVASFGALSKLTTVGIYNMKMVNYIVLDEADTLLDDSFNEKMVYYLSKFPIKVTKNEDTLPGISTGSQLTLVSATFPRSLNTILSNIVEIDSIVNVETPLLHRVKPHVEQSFYRVGHHDTKDRFLKMVKSLHKNKVPTVIFSNSSKCCNFISGFLQCFNIPCLSMFGALSARERLGIFKRFQEGEYNFLSCTDLGSRGLDTVRVEHIINFEFPRFMSDYIHRCGRTGRVGGMKGHVTNFVRGGNDVDLTQKIEYSVRKQEVLPNVNANIKRIIHFKREKYEQKRLQEQEMDRSHSL